MNPPAVDRPVVHVRRAYLTAVALGVTIVIVTVACVLWQVAERSEALERKERAQAEDARRARCSMVMLIERWHGTAPEIEQFRVAERCDQP